MTCCNSGTGIVKFKKYKYYEKLEPGEAYNIYTYVNKPENLNVSGAFYPPITVSPAYVIGDRYYWDVTDINGLRTIGGINHPLYDEDGNSNAWHVIVPSTGGYYKTGCELKPEQKFEIELIQFDASYLRSIPGFSSLPIPTVLTECVIVESAVPLAGPECVVIKKRLGVPYNIFEAIQGVIGLPFESVVRVLCSDPGCPPPQVTVVCGEDEKSDECPPETDCEIVCKGFKCCYSKGKVIKVIPVS